MEKNCFKKPISFLQFIKKALKSYFLERNTYFLLALHVACLRSQNYAISNLLGHQVLEVLRDQCPSVLRLYRGCCSKRSCCCTRRLSNSAFTLLQGGSSWDRQLWSCQLAIRSQSGWNPLTDWRSFDFTLRGCSLSNGQMDTFNVIAWEYTCQGGYICRCY